MEKRKCLVCEKEFTPSHHTNKLCSDKCRLKRINGQVKNYWKDNPDKRKAQNKAYRDKLSEEKKA